MSEKNKQLNNSVLAVMNRAVLGIKKIGRGFIVAFDIGAVYLFAVKPHMYGNASATVATPRGVGLCYICETPA